MWLTPFYDDEFCGQMSFSKRTCLFLLSLALICWAQNDDCSKVDCNTIPVCPPDSVLVKHKADLRECCSFNVTCECDEARCSTSSIKCDPGMEKIQVRKATRRPGQCCDQFECRRPGTLNYSIKPPVLDVSSSL